MVDCHKSEQSVSVCYHDVDWEESQLGITDEHVGNVHISTISSGMCGH